MKTLYTSKNQEILVDDADYPRFNRWTWGINNAGYVVRGETKKGKKINYFLHKEIMGYMKIPDFVIDHINGNKLDNRRENLRYCSLSQNNMNRTHKQSNNTSGYKGVSYKNGKYEARIGKNNKLIYLGMFNTAEEASKAYNQKAEELYGEFARKLEDS